MYIVFIRTYSDAAGCRVVGCPKAIEDKKYKRNMFIFNVVFVFDSSTDTTPYEPVIQKLGEAFKTCEVGSLMGSGYPWPSKPVHSIVVLYRMHVPDHLYKVLHTVAWDVSLLPNCLRDRARHTSAIMTQRGPMIGAAAAHVHGSLPNQVHARIALSVTVLQKYTRQTSSPIPVYRIKRPWTIFLKVKGGIILHI